MYGSLTKQKSKIYSNATRPKRRKDLPIKTKPTFSDWNIKFDANNLLALRLSDREQTSTHQDKHRRYDFQLSHFFDFRPNSNVQECWSSYGETCDVVTHGNEHQTSCSVPCSLIEKCSSAKLIVGANFTKLAGKLKSPPLTWEGTNFPQQNLILWWNFRENTEFDRHGISRILSFGLHTSTRRLSVFRPRPLCGIAYIFEEQSSGKAKARELEKRNGIFGTTWCDRLCFLET